MSVSVNSVMANAASVSDNGAGYAGARPEGRSELWGKQRYSWLGGYLARLEGKEARDDYYARLELYTSSLKK